MTKCFVKGCDSSAYIRRNQESREKRSLFRPTSDEMFQQWRKVIPGGEGFQRKHSICDLHFFREDIISEYVEHCSPQLTPHLYMKPIRLRLKKGAVPSVFGFHKESSPVTIKVENKDEEPEIISDVPLPMSVTIKEEIKEEEEEEETEVVPNVPSRIPTVTIKEEIKQEEPEILPDVPLRISGISLNNQLSEVTDFQIIRQKSDSIPKPSSFWTVRNTSETIVWICWSMNYMKAFRKVVLHPDMSIKIFVEDREMNVEGLHSVENIGDIVKLLNNVSQLLPCFKKGVRRSKDCIGYVVQKDIRKKGPQIEICECCKKYRRKVTRRNNENNFKTKKNIILLNKSRKM
ncbi:uncharacterized protein LOC122499622 [Leptopilina heterotoma]|uniref:uncharacterized protein LOC122499622 n=1 Tax=Leptopilina heterotoma TaxID=63436 RepID=UPI001CA811D7|nr:uncharacterized protein LOC122499622 [Leptopilina heterotoma]XP_043464007.1 uncharacterized protein LOC122499622 [Leptopilina heterotoma]